MSKPFFLTRQSANLMEDFVHETKSGPALFLLYGDPGVGKTRLLQELKLTRLADARVHWVNLASEDQGTTPGDRSAKVERLFEDAKDGDIVIADHFEAALKKTRHQLFVSWSSQGVDKRMGLIIASSSDGFNELRQLSAQYQVRVQSYQLMPLGSEEVEAFLGFYLFPEHPIGKLSMPSPLRKRVAAARGVIGELIKIAESDGSHISTRPLTDNESIRQGSRVIVSVLILFALAVGIGWYLFDRPDTLPRPDLLVESGPPVPVDEAPDPVGEPAIEPAPGAAEAPRAPAEPVADTVSVDAPDPVATEVNAEAEADDPTAGGESDMPVAGGASDETAVEPAEPGAPVVDDDPEIVAAAASAVAAADSQSAPENEPGNTPDPTAEPAVEVASVTPSVSTDAPQTGAQRLLRDLQRSLDWIYDRDATIGTIQILLLSYDNFDVDGYYDYVGKLESEQVDISKVRIFKTLTGDKVFYSVLYGEYATRAAALDAIAGLPRVLRKSGPIPRSVGGVWEEIQRLDSIN